MLAAFDALFGALLKRGDADEAMSLFADDDVVFWGSGSEEQALDRAALAQLFGAITRIGDALSFHWSVLRVTVEGDAAWVSAVGDYRYAPPGEAATGGTYLLTAVFVRREG